MKHPIQGTFLRPVGPFGYCLELVRIVPTEDGEQWVFRRWGMNSDKQPYDDGGGHAKFYIRGVVPVVAGVWKTQAFGWVATQYYRVMDTVRRTPLQLDLL